MISPTDMVLFAAVVREGSFTAAGRALGITKQAASERISKLEARLGVRLLERTTRSLRLTESGMGYADRCTAIAAQVDEANAEVQRRQAEPVGLLRVASPSLYGRRFLTPVVAGYLARHPKAQVEVVLTDRRVDLLEDGFDLAIHIGPLDDSSVIARPLGEALSHVVASPRYLRQHGRPTAKTLATARCIGFSPFEAWKVGDKLVRLEPVLTVNDLEMAADAALAGVGLARVPDLLCRDAVRARRLEILFGPKPAMRRPIQVLYPSRRQLPLKARAFVDALAAAVAPVSREPSPAPGGGRSARRD